MNLLIVDDEFIVVALIKKHIDWKAIGVDEVYAAYNAEEARRYVCERSVDIIICDIEMPQENGLNFLGWVRQNAPSVTSIILTAYPSFQYAQTAIKLGVKQYLLKPVSFDELSATVQGVADSLRAERAPERAAEKPQADAARAMRLFYISLISGDVFPSYDSITKAAGESGLSLETLEPAALVYIRVPDGSADTVYRALKSAAEELPQDVTDVRLLDNIYWVLRDKRRPEELRALCEEFVRRVDESVKVGVTAYFLTHVRLETLTDCTRHLRKLAQQRRDNSKRVYSIDDIIEAEVSHESASEEAPAWSVAEAVMSFIHQHYAEAIGRQSIEEALHMNGDYLNRVFKSVTGYSLIHYIQYYRVLAAKRLMSEEQVSVTEACIRVGFDNPSYFGKVFRKWTGQTPYEFYRQTVPR